MKVLDEYVEECVKAIEAVPAVSAKYGRNMKIDEIEKEVAVAFRAHVRLRSNDDELNRLGEKHGDVALQLWYGHEAGIADPGELLKGLGDADYTFLQANRGNKILWNLKPKNWAGYEELAERLGLDEHSSFFFGEDHDGTIEAYYALEEDDWIDDYGLDTGIVLRVFGKPTEKLEDYHAEGIHLSVEDHDLTAHKLRSIPDEYLEDYIDAVMELDKEKRDLLVKSIGSGTVSVFVYRFIANGIDERWVDNFAMLKDAGLDGGIAAGYAHDKEITDGYIGVIDKVKGRGGFDVIFAGATDIVKLDIYTIDMAVDVYNLALEKAGFRELSYFIDGLKETIRQGTTKQWITYVNDQLMKGVVGGGNYRELFERNVA